MYKYPNPRTKKEALEMCLLMWEYIVENGCSKWVAIEDLELPYLEAGCAACDYAAFRFKEEYPKNDVNYDGPEKYICEFCPISAWNNPKGDKYGCYSSDSPYSAWYDSDRDFTASKSKQYAQQIVELVQADLTNLTDKDSEE